VRTSLVVAAAAFLLPVGAFAQDAPKASPPAPATQPRMAAHLALSSCENDAKSTMAAKPAEPIAYPLVTALVVLPTASRGSVTPRTSAGKSATFTLVSEAILHGNATCLPSAAQCQAIDLAPGQTEQLEYISPTGEVSVYELRVVSIEAAKASAAAVKNLLHKESKAGRELLRQSGLPAIPNQAASRSCRSESEGL